METTLDLVRQRVQTLAEEYRDEGYEVIVEPSQAQLPPFLAGYHPDLLLHKASESVVVDVRVRKSLAKDSQVRELSGLLRVQPGWRFELVLVDVGEQISAPEDAQPFTSEDIMHGAAEAERLLASGFAEAASLRAWAAAEAAVRLLAEEDGVSIGRPTPSVLLKQAVINGLISRDDYKSLLHALDRRNAQVHGFTLPDFDRAEVEALVETARRLESEAMPSPAPVS